MSTGGPAQTVTQLPPAFQMPYMSDVYRMGQQVAYTPYTAYSGQRFAETAPLYQQGVEQAQQLASSPGLLGQINVGGQNMGVMQAYMNPYQQAVTDTAKGAAVREYGQGLQNLKGQAAQRGAFGGSRQAIMESELMKNLGTQLGNIQMQGSAAAYDKAGQLYQQDYANQMAKAQTLQQLGMTDEARRQRDLDAMYEEFQRQRDYPARQAQQYRDIVFGGPAYKSESTYESTGNPLVQGLGLARLLYGGF